jgi:serine/threonine protein kinase
VVLFSDRNQIPEDTSMTKLNIIAGPDKGQIYHLHEGCPLLFGRSRHADCQLKDLSISRVHCEVELKQGRVSATDLDSNSGTFVNGQKIGEVVLKEGDVVGIGDTQMLLEGATISEATTLPLPAEKSINLPASRMAELTGKKLSHFHIGPLLAKADSGMVFKATDFKTDKPVALKVFYPEFAQNDDEMRRFVRAIKTMLPHKHPNLVSIQSAGKTGPYCFISMELIDGESLTQVIQRIGIAGMLDWKYALRVALHIGSALEYAHSKQIIHRNITPQNVLVQTADKVAKLGDLMFAKAQEGALAQQITKPDELLGDVRYMSPERTAGATTLDGRSDLYSLGATIYALLTGRPPCEGNSLVETIKKIRNDVPAKPKKYQMAIPDLFEGTVMKMLAKRPDDRYQTAGNFLKDLEKVAKYQGVQI